MTIIKFSSKSVKLHLNSGKSLYDSHFFQMQTDALYMYERLSVDNTTNDSLEQLKATQQCVKDVDEVRCIAVYCSDDEKYLFTEHTKKYCQNVTKLW